MNIHFHVFSFTGLKQIRITEVIIWKATTSIEIKSIVCLLFNRCAKAWACNITSFKYIVFNLITYGIDRLGPHLWDAWKTKSSRWLINVWLDVSMGATARAGRQGWLEGRYSPVRLPCESAAPSRTPPPPPCCRAAPERTSRSAKPATQSHDRTHRGCWRVWHSRALNVLQLDRQARGSLC